MNDFEKKLNSKLKDFKNEAEYLDALKYFDVNTGVHQYEDYKKDVISIFNKIKVEHGEDIPVLRMNYILMRDLQVNRYDAQHLIQLAIEYGIVGWGQHSDISFKKEHVVSL